MGRVSRHLNATDAQISAFTERLKSFLKGQLRKVAADLQSDNADIMQRGLEAAQTLGRLQSTLVQAGLQSEVAQLRKVYAEQLRFVDSLFAEAKKGKRLYSDADRAVVETLITFDTDKVTATISNYVDDVKSTFMKSVLGGDTSGLADRADVLTDRVGGAVATELTTMSQGFSRAVSAAKASELGIDSFEYEGPDDKITRPFCQRTLEGRNPPIYTRSEIEAMSNGQDLPVMTYGGGYNCRHQWLPVVSGG